MIIKQTKKIIKNLKSEIKKKINSGPKLPK